MIGRLVARHALGAATAATGRGAAGSGTFSGRAPQLAPLRPAALRWRAHRGVAVAAQAEGVSANSFYMRGLAAAGARRAWRPAACARMHAPALLRGLSPCP